MLICSRVCAISPDPNLANGLYGIEFELLYTPKRGVSVIWGGVVRFSLMICVEDSGCLLIFSLTFFVQELCDHPQTWKIGGYGY